MVYFPWILLMLASLAASLFLFIWASRTGQFAEQSRAAYLPLRDMPPDSMPVPKRGHMVAEVYVLVGIIGAAALSLIAAFVLVLSKGYGV
jgi:nitrogen fixation-related uncharacterized protein